MKYIITNCFTFKGLYTLRKAKLSYMSLLFVVLCLVIAFPLNYQIIRNNGLKGLNLYTHELRIARPEWLPDELPSDGYITKNGLMLELNENQTYTHLTTTADNRNYTVIINPKTEVIDVTDTIVLTTDEIIYFGEDGTKLQGDYRNIEQPIIFEELKGLDKDVAIDQFFDMVDSAFNEYMIFFSIIVNIGIQFLMNIIFVIVLGAILLMVRINYKKITTYQENIRIIIGSMVIPSLITLIIGLSGMLELSAFTVVIFQLFTPLIALGAIYKGGTEKEITTRTYK